MKIRNLLFVFGIVVSNTVFAQKFMTRNGNITFNCSTPLEKIEAQNHKVTSVIDAETGKIEFAVLMKAFEFEKALMQDHFNENYAESEKYPKAVFKGNITNNSTVNYSKDGKYPVKLTGQLTMHGVTKDLTSDGTIIVSGGKVSGKSEFKITLEDYAIEIPSLVKDKIAKDVLIIVDAAYEPFKPKASE